MLDMINLVKRGFDAWEEVSNLNEDFAFFTTELLLQKDILDSWQRDWFGFRERGEAVSVGKLRLLKAHEGTMHETLRSLEAELDKLESMRVLGHQIQPESTGERLLWIGKGKQEAKEGLRRVEVLLRGLYTILPRQSPHPAAVVLLNLPETGNQHLAQLSHTMDGSESAQLVQQAIVLKTMRAQLDEDLERRIDAFQSGIPGASLSDIAVPANLEVETGTAGGRSWGHSGNRPVMVEWKDYRILQGQQAIRIRGRVDNMARLLHATPKPAELMTLHCEGYFDDVANKRYGFVFSSPAIGSEEVTSLNKLLTKPPPERLPTLGQRYCIAYQLGLTMFFLLSTEWLHKGLRSHNILFCHQGDNVRWSRPLLCGFAYARPDKPDEVSEKLEHSERFNVYRHRLAQGQPQEGYRKSFDIYSFGVLLFEIATWNTAFPLWNLNATEFQKELTKPNNQKRVAHRMGVDYRDAMLKCIDGSFEGDQGSVTKRFFVEVLEVLRLSLVDGGSW